MRDALLRHAGYLAIVLLNLAALGAAALTLRDPREGAVRIVPPPSPTPAPTATPPRLSVFVSGAVATPDVVVLPEGARARDAVAAAGGFAADADRAAINLAAPLMDGQQLHVPVLGEAPAAGGGTGAGEPAAGGSPGAAPAAGRLDINRASAADLEALPGIGPALAARIVAHRAAHGPFTSVEDLLAVGGIGPKTLDRFAGQIVVR